MRVKGNKAAAAALGITDRQLLRWAKEPWFPRRAKSVKGWDVDAIAVARDAEDRKGSQQSEVRAGIRDATSAEKLKRERLNTQKQEIELRRVQGELVPRAALELFVSTFLTEFGDWCDELPDVFAAYVPVKLRKSFRDRVKQELDRRRYAMRDELQAKAREADRAAS